MNIEDQKRVILRYMGERFERHGDEYITNDEIIADCSTSEDEVKKICAMLEENGLVQTGKKQGKNSYKITTNGLIQVENYLAGTGAGISLSQINEVVKHGLKKIKINPEIQTGIVETGKKNRLGDGLFYIVLIDLAGSTFASSKMSSYVFKDWIKDFQTITKNALNGKQRNVAVFVKFIGDGGLFLFRNFEDILDWKNRVDELCHKHNEKCKKEGKLDFYQYHHKTIIHLSEVFFDEKDSDVNAFGVNVVFKIEKRFSKSEIGITEAVKQIIIQEINSGKFTLMDASSYSLDENEEYKIPLWKLIPT